MSSRGSHLRTKVVALLLSLVALWAFAATITLRDGLNLLWVDTLDQKLDRPTESMITALQQERRLSLIFLSGHTAEQHEALTAQRARTDEARETFQRLAGSGEVRTAASAAEERHIREAFETLNGLDEGRAAIDAGIVDRSHAAATFTDFINVGFRIYGALATLDDARVAERGRTLKALTRAREVLSQEDALLAGMLAAGRFTAGEYASFTQLVGAQRFLYAEVEVALPAAEQARYHAYMAGAPAAQLRLLEDRMMEKGGVGPLPLTADAWPVAVGPVFDQLRDLENGLARSTVKLARPAAVAVLVRLGLAGGLGLIAVIASIIISVTTVRSLSNQLARLRVAALELAQERLPRVVERIRLGEDVDVAAEAPPLAVGPDEVGRVAQAFNTVQRTAIHVAVQQAELRRGVRDVFLNLARRTQALVHRQLTVLDAMERRETEPEDLDNLFRVDHLATRMRRNAENLIVLSGAVPGRGWRNPVPLVDVVRGAVGEVEDYARVSVLPIGPAALEGRAVGDIIHLLAELIENATSFSPPDTIVQVGGQKVAHGFAVEIEDRGLGMTEMDLAAANEELRNPPEFNLSRTARLGLYVVGQLAQRHGVRVQLRESPYGGVMAIVLIPSTLVVELDEPEAVPEILAAPRRRAALTAAPAPPEPPAGPVAAPEPVSALAAPEPVSALAAPEPVSALAAPEPVSALALAEAVADPPAAEPAGFTPNGLPKRVRQANLAAPLHTDEPPAADPDPPPALRRSPEEVRRMMASYQRGTMRGRSLAITPEHASEDSPVTDQDPAGDPGER